MASNKQIAENVLAAVGGKENISMVTHCMTRLRFNLNNRERVNADEVKKIEGVLSVIEAGGQFQVVIGTNVSKVYAELCEIGGFAKQETQNAAQDKPKEKLTVKSFFNGILNGIAGCMTPLIPLLCVAGLLKMIPVLFGPNMLNVMSAESDLYVLFTFLGDTGFYFLPIFLGYTGAKKFGCTPILGMLLGAMLIHPTFVALATTEAAPSAYTAFPARWKTTAAP